MKLEKNTHTKAWRERILARWISRGSRSVPPSARHEKARAAEFQRNVERVARVITVGGVPHYYPYARPRGASIAWLYTHARTPAEVETIKAIVQATKNARREAREEVGR